MAEKMIALVSSEGEKVEYPKSVCEKSNMVKGMLEDYDEDEYTIDGIAIKELKTVMEFCSYINNNAFPQIVRPLSTGDFNEALQGNEWYVDFVNKLEKDEVFAVGLAANAMEIPELLDLISCKIACLTYGKSVEEMR